MPLAVVVHIIWRCFSSYMQYGDWKWLKNTLDTACCVDSFNFSVYDLSVYISLSFWMCMYTEKQVFWSVRSSATSPFDRVHTTSYLTFIETMCLSHCLQCFDTVGWATGRATGL